MVRPRRTSSESSRPERDLVRKRAPNRSWHQRTPSNLNAPTLREEALLRQVATKHCPPDKASGSRSPQPARIETRLQNERPGLFRSGPWFVSRLSFSSKCGAFLYCTWRVKAVVCAVPPPEPVIVMEYVPVLAVLAAVNVSLDEPEPGAAIGLGLKLAVTPRRHAGGRKRNRRVKPAGNCGGHGDVSAAARASGTPKWAKRRW